VRWCAGVLPGEAPPPRAGGFLRRSYFENLAELLEKMEIKVYNESRMTFSGERRAA